MPAPSMSYYGLWSQQEAGKKQIIFFHVDELYQVLEKPVKVMVAGWELWGTKEEQRFHFRWEETQN